MDFKIQQTNSLKRQSKQLWKLTLRNLNNERAVWSNSLIGDYSYNNNYWKLDPVEDNFRRRRRLKKNYNFNPHFDAIIRRDEKIKKKSDQLINNLTNLLSEQNKKNWKLAFSISRLNEQDDGIENAQLQNDLFTEENYLNKNVALLKIDCKYIVASQVFKGILEISNTYLHFYSIQLKGNSKSEKNNSSIASNSINNGLDNTSKFMKDRFWQLDSIKEMRKMSFRFQRSAIEFHLMDKTTIFLNFNKNKTNKVFKFIINLKPKNLSNIISKTPKEIIKKSKYTKLWQKRKISNFEYLMRLNFISGRTYNDLSQYPVFPWVLSDYTSETIDLNDPKVYRDLSKPIGALNSNRLQIFENMYESLKEEDGDIPPFFYGSHYLNAASVLFYLIRLEPFTTWGVDLHGGKFDHADRTFFSIPLTWKNCLNLSADVKELIPEFYYLPEFLQNLNGFDLGTRQDKQKIEDVELPPWANNSPSEFIRIMREALESEYVSEHLHEWIDLIFGYQQRGSEAVKAKNLFYYLTYENAINLDLIEDEEQKKSILSQIDNFGQCCSQLFIKPHPKRLSKDLLKQEEEFCPTPHNKIIYKIFPTNKRSIIFLSNFTNNNILIFDQERYLNINNISLNKIQHLKEQQKQQQVPQQKQEGIQQEAKKKNEDQKESDELKHEHKEDQKKEKALQPTFKNQEVGNKKNKEDEKEQQLINEGKEMKNRIENIDDKKDSNNSTNEEAIDKKKIQNINRELILNNIQFNYDLHNESKSKIGSTFANNLNNFVNCFSLLDSKKYFLSSGYCDNSFKIENIESGKLIQSISVHKDAVTAVSHSNNLIVTGSRDTTVMLWEYSPKMGKIQETPKQILFGHDAPITCLDIDHQNDLIISSSLDNTCILHSLVSGRYIRTISPKSSGCISLCHILPNSNILLYSKESKKIWLYSINGELLAEKFTKSIWNSWKFFKNGKFFLTIGTTETFQIWSIANTKFEKINSFKIKSVPNTIEFLEEYLTFLIGLNDGSILIGTFIKK